MTLAPAQTSQGACRGSRLRAAAAQYVDDPAQATAAQIDSAAWDTVPPVAAAVLVVPLHGRARLFLHRDCSPSGSTSPPDAGSRKRRPVLRLALGPSAAVDRRGTRLVRRREWPAALGHRRRAADVPGGLADSRHRAWLLESRRFRRCSTPCWPSIDVYLLTNTCGCGPAPARRRMTSTRCRARSRSRRRAPLGERSHRCSTIETLKRHLVAAARRAA